MANLCAKPIHYNNAYNYNLLVRRMENKTCLFCDKDNLEKHSLILENQLFYSIWDNFPVSPGHAVVVPKKHITSLFDLTQEELVQMFDLLKKTEEIIKQKYLPDAYNIGINEGEAAGRTIDHLHIHIIPRFFGDVDDYVGGVRHIIPGKGNYRK